MNNQGNIESNGTGTISSNIASEGGNSGGGSINIFYLILLNQGDISAIGGKTASTDVYRGGTGGDGSVTMTQFTMYYCLIKQNNQYYSIKPEFYDEERDQYSPILLQNPTVDDFNNYGVLDLGTIKFNALNKILSNNKYNIAMLK